MTDEELAAIKARINDPLTLPPGMTEEALTRIHEAWHDRQALIAELERLAAAIREIAGDHMHQWEAIDPQEVWACETCHAYSQDYAEEVQEKACALLRDMVDGDDAGYSITVNGQRHTVDIETLNYAQVLTLAGIPTAAGMAISGALYTVVYERADHSGGSLTPGQSSVHVEDEMHFTAVITGRA